MNIFQNLDKHGKKIDVIENNYKKIQTLFHLISRIEV